MSKPRWLFIGITRKEIREKGYPMPTDEFILLDRGDFGPFRKGDIDFKGDCFDISVWTRILTIFGAESFDVIMMDGGLFGLRRVDDIIRIKRSLLKPNGYILNYTSSIGERVICPLGRNLLFYKISKKDYTVEYMERKFDTMEAYSLADTLKKGLRIIV
tara:strand:+ start:57 stop:533 length:477 start_codon:yes stop_codon:yes gene_type:complete